MNISKETQKEYLSAVNEGNLEKVEGMKDKYENINLVSMTTTTKSNALHFACSKLHVEMMKKVFCMEHFFKENIRMEMPLELGIARVKDDRFLFGKLEKKAKELVDLEAYMVSNDLDLKKDVHFLKVKNQFVVDKSRMLAEMRDSGWRTIHAIAKFMWEKLGFVVVVPDNFEEDWVLMLPVSGASWLDKDEMLLVNRLHSIKIRLGMLDYQIRLFKVCQRDPKELIETRDKLIQNLETFKPQSPKQVYAPNLQQTTDHWISLFSHRNKLELLLKDHLETVTIKNLKEFILKNAFGKVIYTPRIGTLVLFKNILTNECSHIGRISCIGKEIKIDAYCNSCISYDINILKVLDWRSIAIEFMELFDESKKPKTPPKKEEPKKITSKPKKPQIGFTKEDEKKLDNFIKEYDRLMKDL